MEKPLALSHLAQNYWLSLILQILFQETDYPIETSIIIMVGPYKSSYTMSQATK